MIPVATVGDFAVFGAYVAGSTARTAIRLNMSARTRLAVSAAIGGGNLYPHGIHVPSDDAVWLVGWNKRPLRVSTSSWTSATVPTVWTDTSPYTGNISPWVANGKIWRPRALVSDLYDIVDPATLAWDTFTAPQPSGIIAAQQRLDGTLATLMWNLDRTQLLAVHWELSGDQIIGPPLDVRNVSVDLAGAGGSSEISANVVRSVIFVDGVMWVASWPERLDPSTDFRITRIEFDATPSRGWFSGQPIGG